MPRDERTGALLRALLTDPVRDRVPGVRPVVAWHQEDPPEHRAAIRARLYALHELSRRGTWHGLWAELAPEHPGGRGSGAHSPQPPTTRELRFRWRSARPCVLPARLARSLERTPRVTRDAVRLEETLEKPGGLGRFVRRALGGEGSPWRVSPRRARLADPERDLEKLFVVPLTTTRRKPPEVWLKSARLSTHPDDASLRLRVSAGREIDEDDTGDLERLKLVAELGEELIPGMPLVTGDLEFLALLERLAGEEVLLTQPIAYWNAPEGGARFHHDAFAPSPHDAQLGVVYAQLSGRTAWLALSIEDLAERVAEAVEWMAQGDLAWVRAKHWPRAEQFERLRARARDRRALLRELALPGCGRFGPLVDRGPEFTSLLADAGHGFVLEPGDVLLLPNHGLDRTVMHSVFCADPTPTYGLSLAIRGTSAPVDSEEETNRRGPFRRRSYR